MRAYLRTADIRFRYSCTRNRSARQGTNGASALRKGVLESASPLRTGSHLQYQENGAGCRQTQTSRTVRWPHSLREDADSSRRSGSATRTSTIRNGVDIASAGLGEQNSRVEPDRC